MQEIPHARYYNIHESKQERYLFQTRSQAKTSGSISPKVHAVDKGENPNIKPEKQIIKPLVTAVQSHTTKSKDQYIVNQE